MLRDSLPETEQVTDKAPSDQSEEVSPLIRLPEETWLAILLYFRPEELLIIALADRFFRRLSRDEVFWKPIFVRHFPHLALETIAITESENNNAKTSNRVRAAIEEIDSDTETDEESVTEEETNTDEETATEQTTNTDEESNTDESTDTGEECVSDAAEATDITVQSEPKFDWHATFIGTHAREYNNLSPSAKRLLFLIKEGDNRSLSCISIHFGQDTIPKGDISIDDLDRVDASGNTALDWAKQLGNVSVCNDFYLNIALYYTTVDANHVPHLDVTQIDSKNRTILYWAIRCHQSRQTLESLLTMGSQLNEEYGSGVAPIHIAAQAGNVVAIDLFTEREPSFVNLRLMGNPNTPLMFAAIFGKLAAVQSLCAKNGILTHTTRNHDYYNALHCAVAHGRASVIPALIQAKLSVTVYGKDGHFPMHIAALDNHVNAIKALTQGHRELFNQTNVQNATPLAIAAFSGHLATVKFILKHNSDDFKIDLEVVANKRFPKHGGTALYLAAAAGHHEIVVELMNAGADALFRHPNQLLLPIHIAIVKNRLTTVMTCIKYMPALLRKVSGKGLTPLMLAAWNGHVEIVKYLLLAMRQYQKFKMNVDIRSPRIERSTLKSQDCTALLLAADGGHSEVVIELLKAGADPSLSRNGLQAIHVAAMGGHVTTVQALVEHEQKPTSVNQPSGSGQTPLMIAAEYGHPRLLKYLLQQDDIQIDATDPSGKTAFDIAISSWKSKEASLLVKAGARVVMPTDEATSRHPAHAAAYDGDIDRLRSLLKHTKYILDMLNRKDAYGHTPFLLAAARGHLDIVNYLMAQAGINIDAITDHPLYIYSGYSTMDPHGDGMSALHWAALFGHNAVVDSIVNSGKRWRSQMPFVTGKLSKPVKEKLLTTSILNDLNCYIEYLSCLSSSSTSISSAYHSSLNLPAARRLKEVLLKQQDASTLKQYQQELCEGTGRRLPAIFKRCLMLPRFKNLNFTDQEPSSSWSARF